MVVFTKIYVYSHKYSTNTLIITQISLGYQIMSPIPFFTADIFFDYSFHGKLLNK